MFVALLIASVLVLLMYCKWRHSYWSSRGVYSPPCPLLLGHTLHLNNVLDYRENFVDKLYRKHTDSRVVGLYLFNKPLALINDLELAQRVLIKDFEYFTDRIKVDLTAEADLVFNDMLTNATGLHWKSLRSMFTPTFTSGKMKTMFHLVQGKTNALVEHCEEASRTGESVDFMDLLRKFALDVIGTCAFGLEIDLLGGGDKEFSQAVKGMNKIKMSSLVKVMITKILPPLASILKLQLSTKEIQFLKNVVERVIEERRKMGTGRGDFVDLMLTNQNSSGEKSFVLTDRSIVAQGLLFLFAGLDTTSLTLSFIFKLLTQHPQYQTMIRDELESKLKQDNVSTPTYEHIMEARHLDAFISETMRRYPVAVCTERLCTKDYRVPGTAITIPAGMTVWVHIYSHHFDESLFPEPFEFRPERFIDRLELPSCAYLPFGAGPRMCIAQRFALMNLKLATAHMLMHYQLKSAPGYEDIQLSRIPGIRRPKDGSVQIKLEKIK